MSSNQHIDVQQSGVVMTVTLRRPDTLNALTASMFDDLARLVDRLTFEDLGVRVLVLRGAGRGFCSGVDLDDVREMSRGSAQQARGMVRKWQRTFELLEDLEIPVVAVLHGFAIGGGLELAMSADLRIAEKATKFSFPETLIGGIPDGGSQRLARLVGIGRAKALIMTAKQIDGDEAERIGLVSESLPAAELEDGVAETIDRLLAASPAGTGLTKRVLNRGFGTDLRNASELELLASSPLYAGPDMRDRLDRSTSQRSRRAEGKADR